MAWNSFANPFGHAITHPFDVAYHYDGGFHAIATAAPRVIMPNQQFALPSAQTFAPSQHVMPTNGTSAHSHPPATLGDGVDAATTTAGIASMKSGVLSHFDMQLAAIYKAQVGDVGTSVAPSQQFNTAFSTDSAGQQFVTIDVTVKDQNGNHQIDANESQAVLDQLNALGMTHGSKFAGVVSGMLAVDKVADLGALLSSGDLGFARVSGVQTSVGLVDSQADIAERGDAARHDWFVSGDGVRVGVLSDSFDAAHHVDTSMADDIASNDLPNDTVIVQEITSSGGTDEGRGMAQLVHDIAPDAAIDFATAFTGQAGFANNILALAAAGDQVITDDVIYYFELAYQEGPIAQAVTQVYNDGVSYFSSAGNNGHEGLEQAWVSGGTMYGETMMQFAAGQDYIPITLAAFEVIILQWDEPGASAGGAGSASDVDLFLTDITGGTVYLSSIAGNIGGDPIEGIGVSGGSGNTYYLRVGLYAGPAPTEIKLVALGNGAPVDLGTTATNFNNGTMYGHAAADGALAVGAVRYDATPAWGVNPPDSEYFTSAGPTRIWFDDAGVRLAAPEDRAVDMSAVDGANTTFFGFDYEGDGHPNFFGTSAAAPDAAAVAALIIEARGNLTPDDIANLLKDSCLDMDNNNAGGTIGFDNGPDAETGAGLVQADLAVGFARTLHIENADAVVLTGTHFSDVIMGNGNVNIINGGDGNDVIHGGIRGDTLTGGNGSDTFVYDGQFDSAGIRHDTITDLEDLYDTIDLTKLDADDVTGGDQAFTIVAHHTPGAVGELEVRYHAHGAHAGTTLIRGWTNDDHKVDVYIIANGDHSAFTGFDL